MGVRVPPGSPTDRGHHMDRSRYIIELPELAYDRAALLCLVNNPDAQWFHYVTPDNRTVEHRQLKMPDINIPCVKHILDQLHPDLDVDRGSCKFLRMEPHYEMPAHIDPPRTAALMFKIEPTADMAPLRWVTNDGDVLFEYNYRHPVLINTKLRHGVINNQYQRTNFQISLQMQWQDLLDLETSGKLLLGKDRELY